MTHLLVIIIPTILIIFGERITEFIKRSLISIGYKPSHIIEREAIDINSWQYIHNRMKEEALQTKRGPDYDRFNRRDNRAEMHRR
jgi:hypothetical protein